MKVGDLVVYVRGPRKTDRYKWKKKSPMIPAAPGILIEEIAQKGTTSRMFSVRWHSGIITDEWTAFLLPYGEG
tara:strand:- start:97 stop:315 length:219 start_codon:yes stop_codon:yes gene_type:complete